MRSMRAAMMDDRAIALADCNNFFVSCERRVAPELENRPVVVLSCNDGCVVSRSNEVKKLGVKMGDPFFKIRDMLAYNGVAVRSSNLRLYQEISAEVMARLRLYSDAAEQYSIDESFFNMAIASISDPVAYCRELRSDILCHCHIPVSIGLAPTKTLAKLGTEYAKHHEETGGVFWVDRAKYMDRSFMSQFECRDVWGIGRLTSQKLLEAGVRTAAEFVALDGLYLKRVFGISLLNTLWELQGQQASGLASARRAPRSIMVSRSFGKHLHTFEELLDPLVCFTASASKQLRAAGQSAGRLGVYITTSRFAENYYANSREVAFNAPACLDSVFIPAAGEALRHIYVSGYDYAKCGVILSDFTDVSSGAQSVLFTEDVEPEARRLKAVKAIDAINTACGRVVVKPAALFSAPGQERKWAPRSEFRSGNTDRSDSPLPDGMRFQTHSEDCL